MTEPLWQNGAGLGAFTVSGLLLSSVSLISTRVVVEEIVHWLYIHSNSVSADDSEEKNWGDIRAHCLDFVKVLGS